MKIEELFSQQKYDLVFNELNENPQLETDEHLINLFLRSANKIGKNVWYRFKDNIHLSKNADFLWNKIQYTEDNEEKKNIAPILLKSIFKNNREDLLDDFMLFYFDNFSEYPQYNDYLLYIVENLNKPSVKKYLNNLDEANEYYDFLIKFIKKKDLNEAISRLSKISNFTELSYITFLKGKHINKENFSKFLKSFDYKKDIFVIYEGDIFIIDKYDKITKEFLLKDKMRRSKKVPFAELITKTDPIKQDDFRVYKFFKPENAKNLLPCELLTLILKYKKTAIDRNTLKKELMYIYGKDTQKWLMKNKKEFEKCENVEIFYGKTEKYMLVNEDSGLINHIKRLKLPDKIRDYIINYISKREIKDKQKNEIIEFINKIDSPIKNEINFILTNEVNNKELININDLSIFKYKPFIKYILKIKISENNFDNSIIKILMNMNENDIENLYKINNDNFNKLLIEKTEKELRLGKDINILKWYAVYHINDNLIGFDIFYIIERIMKIADEIFMTNKSHNFVIFARKFLFGNKNMYFIQLMDIMNRDNFRKLFDIFLNIKFINDYQKDEIRKIVYKKYANFRTFEKREYLYSTKENIIKKKEELDDIIKNKLPELSKIINEAAELGDLSENAEYKYAREQYKFLSTKAEQIQKELSESAPIEFSLIDGKTVNYGTIITIENEDKKKITYTILGPFDVDTDNNIISYKSPLIQKLIGKKKGDTIDNIKILEIKKYDNN